jgi:hypothetical protein
MTNIKNISYPVSYAFANRMKAEKLTADLLLSKLLGIPAKKVAIIPIKEPAKITPVEPVKPTEVKVEVKKGVGKK